MKKMTAQTEIDKKLAAEKAVQFIKSGMVVGLGTGSTAAYAIKMLGKLVKQNKIDIIGIPTSVKTANLAKKCSIPLSTISEYGRIDVTIDGADEIDSNYNLIKGGGGALFREKLIARISDVEIIIADASKRVEKLCTKFSIPVEVVPFALSYCIDEIKKLGAERIEIRKAGRRKFVTDNLNYILDCKFAPLYGSASTEKLEKKLNSITGVVENGLFVNMADIIIIASKGKVSVHRVKKKI
jgi:ribose 5-phosphate isomerase A